MGIQLLVTALKFPGLQPDMYITIIMPARPGSPPSSIVDPVPARRRAAPKPQRESSGCQDVTCPEPYGSAGSVQPDHRLGPYEQLLCRILGARPVPEPACRQTLLLRD